MEKCRNLSFNIVESVNFYPAFLLPELGPTEDSKAEFDGCRIKGIYRSSQVEDFRNIQITSFFHHKVGKFFKDAIVSILVRFRQIATCHRVTKAKELSLAAVSLYCDYQVSQTIASGELTEHKNFQLVPT